MRIKIVKSLMDRDRSLECILIILRSSGRVWSRIVIKSDLYFRWFWLLCIEWTVGSRVQVRGGSGGADRVSEEVVRSDWVHLHTGSRTWQFWLVGRWGGRERDTSGMTPTVWTQHLQMTCCLLRTGFNSVCGEMKNQELLPKGTFATEEALLGKRKGETEEWQD